MNIYLLDGAFVPDGVSEACVLFGAVGAPGALVETKWQKIGPTSKRPFLPTTAINLDFSCRLKLLNV